MVVGKNARRAGQSIMVAGKLGEKGQHESTLQCRRCQIKPVKINDGGDGRSVDVELLDENGAVSTGPFECEDLEIIFMNDNGQTIYRKVW